MNQTQFQRATNQRQWTMGVLGATAIVAMGIHAAGCNVDALFDINEKSLNEDFGPRDSDTTKPPPAACQNGEILLKSVCSLIVCMQGNATLQNFGEGQDCNDDKDGVCDGLGNCVECMQDADCAALASDGNNATCGTDNICMQRLAAGKACTEDNECDSTYCQDNVCCVTQCKGACKSCNLAGTAGTCTGVPAGTTDECADVNVHDVFIPGCNGKNKCQATGGNSQICFSNGACLSKNCIWGICVP